jgi:cold shock CspA family protein
MVHYSVNDRPRNGQRRPRVQLVHERDMTRTGVIKWFDVDKRFGFITMDNDRDVFLHASVVTLYGIRFSDLQKGVPVRFEYEPKVGRRPEATAIALA